MKTTTTINGDEIKIELRPETAIDKTVLSLLSDRQNATITMTKEGIGFTIQPPLPPNTTVGRIGPSVLTPLGE